MIIHLGRAEWSVSSPEDCGRLHLETALPDAAAVEDGLRAHGLGRLADDEHVWLSVSALHERASRSGIRTGNGPGPR